MDSLRELSETCQKFFDVIRSETCPRRRKKTASYLIAYKISKTTTIINSQYHLSTTGTDNSTPSRDAAFARVRGLPPGYIRNPPGYHEGYSIPGKPVRVSAPSAPPTDGKDRLAFLLMLETWLPKEGEEDLFEKGKLPPTRYDRERGTRDLGRFVFGETIFEFSDLTTENLRTWNAFRELRRAFRGQREQPSCKDVEDDMNGALSASRGFRRGNADKVKQILAQLRTAMQLLGGSTTSSSSEEDADHDLWERQTNLDLWQTWQEVWTTDTTDNRRVHQHIPVRNARLEFNYTRKDPQKVSGNNFRVVLKMEEGADGRGVISALEMAFGDGDGDEGRVSVHMARTPPWRTDHWLRDATLGYGASVHISRTPPWDTMRIDVGPTFDSHLRAAQHYNNAAHCVGLLRPIAGYCGPLRRAIAGYASGPLRRAIQEQAA